MDPTTARDTMIALADEILKDEDQTDEAVELAELVKNLDEWMCKGGFSPDAWRKPGN